MKTWRERIVEARERGKFTEEDVRLASSGATCAVGEVALTLGKTFADLVWGPSGKCGDKGPMYGLSADFTTAVYAGRLDMAEDRLDAIEDIALQLKREATP